MLAIHKDDNRHGWNVFEGDIYSWSGQEYWLVVGRVGENIVMVAIYLSNTCKWRHDILDPVDGIFQKDTLVYRQVDSYIDEKGERYVFD